MSAFFEALDQGYTPEQVLGYLSKSIPQMGSLIKKAQRSGYPAQQILGFLSKNFDTEDRTGMSTSERTAANRRADAERTKYGLKLAGSAVALPIAGIAARTALSRSLPSSIQKLLPGIGEQVVQNASDSQSLDEQTLKSQSTPSQIQNQSQTLTSQPPISNNLTNPEVSIQPEVKNINVSEILNKHGLLRHVNELSSRTKDPKAVAAILYNKFPKEMKDFQKEAGKNMEDAIADFMQGNEIEEIASQAQELDKPKKPMTREEALGKFRDNIINKGSTVASPQGVGEVKEIRNGKALIEVDGKKHQVNEDELIQSPIPEKDLADLYEELTQGIEKTTGKQISRNVEWAGYDPNTNELAYKPHGSDQLYAYDDISPEDVEVLTSLLTQRKSTGENFIGAWEAGTESPIGAAMYQLIKKLQSQRGGKGNEYKNKFMTIYDALEPAKKALKERYAERKKKAKKPRLD